MNSPLAARMRPRSLNEFWGQSHLLGAKGLLKHLVEQGVLHSMILWGPPGVGKTSLAHVISHTANAHLAHLSAVTAGVKELREVVEQAHTALPQPTLLFIDEVHRFNKAQQDVLLPHVESGLLTLIGATTENPSFALNNALLSRAKVYCLKPLTVDELTPLLTTALQDPDRGLGETTWVYDPTLLTQLAEWADGDARRALNSLELLTEWARANHTDTLTADMFHTILQTDTTRRFDQQGDIFHEQISALHKSVRGSSPQAALYWLARMIDGGVDPLYVARRIVRMASEDIGNADPRALTIALNAWDVIERLGQPEGNLALAQAVTYLSSAPKSNAIEIAWQKALADAKRLGSLEVPLHLRNAPTHLLKSLGYGKRYRYAHDEPHAYAAGENYFPETMDPHTTYYVPTPRGLESKIQEKLARLKALDAETHCAPKIHWDRNRNPV